MVAVSSSPIRPTGLVSSHEKAANAFQSGQRRSYTVWDDLYLRDDSVTLPGFSNVLFEPIAMIEPIMTLWKTKGPRKFEVEFDATMRLLQSPFVIVESLASSISMIHKIGRFFGAFKPTVSWIGPAVKASVIGGLILTGFEALIETKDLVFHTLPLLLNVRSQNAEGDNAELIQQLSQLDRRYLSLSERQKATIQKKNQLFVPLNVQAEDRNQEFKSRITEVLGEIQAYTPELYKSSREMVVAHILDIEQGLKSGYRDAQAVGIQKANLLFQTLRKNTLIPLQEAATAPIIQSKNRDLAIRVRPWLAQEIDEKLPKLLHTLRTGTDEEKAAARIETKELLKNIKTQAIKKVIGHVLAYTAIALTIAGLALTIVGAPYVIVGILIFAGAGFAISRYLFNKGIGDSQGWQFKKSNCVPEIVKKAWRWYCKNNATATMPPTMFPVPCF